MAIINWDGFIGSAKQPISLFKSAARTTIAGFPFSVFELAGNPGAGVLAGTSTTTGVVPTDATAGCPIINAFGGGATGYLAQLEFGNTVACRLKLFDLLWKGGAYAFNASVSGQTPTSFSSRVPGGTDFTDTQIWVEQVTAATGNQAVNVTYTNQSGTTGRTTGATGIGAAPTVGRLWQLPLQSGDTGVQGVTGVACTVASAGTFNVLVMRPIWSGRVKVANDGDIHDLTKTGMPVLYADSAIYMAVIADSSSSGVPEIELVVANG